MESDSDKKLLSLSAFGGGGSSHGNNRCLNGIGTEVSVHVLLRRYKYFGKYKQL